MDKERLNTEGKRGELIKGGSWWGDAGWIRSGEGGGVQAGMREEGKDGVSAGQERWRGDERVLAGWHHLLCEARVSAGRVMAAMG